MSVSYCPVCGMDATESSLTAEHIGITYHFCSEQCLENFTARPRLYIGKGAQKAEGKAIIKRRVFTLDRPVPDADAGALEAALLRMMGVKEVEISGAKVAVSYDLLEATAAQVGREIEQAGADLGKGWAARFKRGWLQYTEETELENLTAEDAPCCNRPPHG
jgi:YHS domain-containing protein/copper chaperone CopZ